MTSITNIARRFISAEGAQSGTIIIMTDSRPIKRMRGFTFVEILMVGAIISLISGIVYASIGQTKKAARDAERRVSLVQLRIALDLYRERNGVYPSTGGVWFSSEVGDAVSNNSGNWIPSLAPSYIGALPKDPRGDTSDNPASSCVGRKRAYLYKSDGVNYALLSHCAMERSLVTGDPLYDSVRPTYAIKVCSPGGCGY